MGTGANASSNAHEVRGSAGRAEKNRGQTTVSVSMNRKPWSVPCLPRRELVLPVFDDPAVAERDHAIADGRILLGMRDLDNGRARLVELAE